MSKFTLSRRCAFTFAAVALAASSLSGCAGENAAAGEILTLDYATYNPLSLVLKEKGWLEDALADDGISVEWIQSAGSNKANEALRADAIDVAPPPLRRPAGPLQRFPDQDDRVVLAARMVSTGRGQGFTGFLGRRPEGQAGRGHQGHRPYFFLLQALQEAGLGEKDITLQNVQHADGRTALANGSVDAWSGLDPIMRPPNRTGHACCTATWTSTPMGRSTPVRTSSRTARKWRRPWLTPMRRRASGPAATRRKPHRSWPMSPDWTLRSPTRSSPSDPTSTWRRSRARSSFRCWATLAGVCRQRRCEEPSRGGRRTGHPG